MLNMNLAKLTTAAIALPLVWVELVVASALAMRFLPVQSAKVAAAIG